jgi:hypothetical protein
MTFHPNCKESINKVKHALYKKKVNLKIMKRHRGKSAVLPGLC